MNYVKLFRQEQHIPLDAFAHLTGLSRWVIRAIELGYRKATAVEQAVIARLLGKTKAELFPKKAKKASK